MTIAITFKSLLNHYQSVLKDHQNRYVLTEGVIEDLERLDKQVNELIPVVPQKVADWYEEHKDDIDYNLWNEIFDFDNLKNSESSIAIWINETKDAIKTLINMHQFGYKVGEIEKRYLVKMKGISEKDCYLRLGRNTGLWWFGGKVSDGSDEHTREELEHAGFGDVFDSPLFEVTEA